MMKMMMQYDMGNILSMFTLNDLMMMMNDE